MADTGKASTVKRTKRAIAAKDHATPAVTAPVMVAATAPVEPAVAVTEVVAPEPVVAEPASPAPVQAQPAAVVAEPAAAKVFKAKPAPKTAAPKIMTPKLSVPKPVAAKPTTPKPAVTAPMIGATAKPSKDTRTMTTTTATDYTAKMSTVLKDAQDKAKAAFEKNQASMGEMGQFAKGNVEAIVASTKILASGLQEMTKVTMTEGKTAIETLTAEVKELTSAKSPTEFLELQTAMLRKQFDAMVAVSSKNSEAMLKLTTEAFQPISNRVSMAVEKIKHAA